MKLLLLLIALFIGGWMIFDGSRAFIVGDYVTPSAGPKAGQLGPWSRIVSAVGLEPRSPVVKGLHILCGIAWLIGLLCFLVRAAIGWWVLLICSICTLWYLPIGTFLSVVEIALLLSPYIRSLK